MAYNRLIDMTENPMHDLAIAQSIGGGIGAAFGLRARSKEQAKIRQRETMLISLIGQAQGQGWDAAKLYSEVIKIPQYAESPTYQRFATGSGFSRLRSGGQSSDYNDYLTQYTKIAEELRTVIEGIPEGEDPEDNSQVRFLRGEMERAMRMLNPSKASSMGTTQGSNILFSHTPQAPETFTGSPMSPTGKQTTKADKAIEKEVATYDTGYPDPSKTMRAVIDRNPARAQRELELARQTKPQEKKNFDAKSIADMWKDAAQVDSDVSMLKRAFNLTAEEVKTAKKWLAEPNVTIEDIMKHLSGKAK